MGGGVPGDASAAAQGPTLHSKALEDGSTVLPTDSKGLWGAADKSAPGRAGIGQLSGPSALSRSTLGE